MLFLHRRWREVERYSPRSSAHSRDSTKLQATNYKQAGPDLLTSQVVEALVDIVCDPSNGVLDKDSRPVAQHLWPSNSTLALSSTSVANTHILAWAAAGAIKNLALNARYVRPKLLGTTRALECLCRLLASPDWLEVIKAKQAIAHLNADCSQAKGKQDL